MDTKTITFNNLPEAMAHLIKKVDNIESILYQKQDEQITVEAKQWMSMKELQDYHPDHPAAPTVYGWVRNNQIPFYKVGKKLSFKKSEIDEWLEKSRAKTFDEIQEEADKYIYDKRKRR